MPLLEQVLEKYPEEVKVVFKNFPLRNHKFARKAAIAALAAERQGKFWEFHDQIFSDYKRLSDAKMQEISRQLGLDSVKFERDTKDPKLKAKVNDDLREGVKAGVRGTPTVFVNGKRLKNRSLKGFQTVIDKELKKVKKGG